MRKIIFWALAALLALPLCTACNSDDDEPTDETGYVINPTTVEGTWHLLKAQLGFVGLVSVEPGQVVVTIAGGKMSVKNNSDYFIKSGTYKYSVIGQKTNKYDGTVVTTIQLSDRQYVYWLKDGELVIDSGSASDAPAYHFRKLP